MITILGAFALIALVTNLYFCVKALTKEVQAGNMVISTLSNVVGVPCIILLFVVIGHAAFG